LTGSRPAARFCGMPVRPQFAAWILEQLAGVNALRSRPMFGGLGLYSGDRFFGLIDDDVLYLKVDDSNRGDFAARGCRAFQPFKEKPEYSMSYYDVPADVLEDADELARWALKSVAVAAASHRSGRRKAGSAGTKKIHRRRLRR
jgi:DNA transformation protein